MSLWFISVIKRDCNIYLSKYGWNRICCSPNNRQYGSPLVRKDLIVFFSALKCNEISWHLTSLGRAFHSWYMHHPWTFKDEPSLQSFICCVYNQVIKTFHQTTANVECLPPIFQRLAAIFIREWGDDVSHHLIEGGAGVPGGPPPPPPLLMQQEHVECNVYFAMYTLHIVKCKATQPIDTSVTYSSNHTPNH